MVAMDHFDPLGQRDQPFQLGPVGLVVAGQDMIDQRAGFLRRVLGSGVDQALQAGGQIGQRQARLVGGLGEAGLAAAAEADAMAAEDLGAAPGRVLAIWATVKSGEGTGT